MPARPGAPVAPHRARALGDADRVRGLRGVHARLQQLRIAGSPCGLHVTQPFVHDPLELVAHCRNLRFLKVLRRPLELAGFTTLGVEWLYSIFEDYLYISVRTIMVQLVSLILMFALVHKPSDYIIYAAISVFATSAANIWGFFYSR